MHINTQLKLYKIRPFLVFNQLLYVSKMLPFCIQFLVEKSDNTLLTSDLGAYEDAQFFLLKNKRAGPTPMHPIILKPTYTRTRIQTSQVLKRCEDSLQHSTPKTSRTTHVTRHLALQQLSATRMTIVTLPGGQGSRPDQQLQSFLHAKHMYLLCLGTMPSLILTEVAAHLIVGSRERAQCQRASILISISARQSHIAQKCCRCYGWEKR